VLVTAQIWPRICLYRILFAGSITSDGAIESGEIKPAHPIPEAKVSPFSWPGGCMHALFNRLRVGGAPQAWVSDPETAADLLQQADEALEAAQIRIAQLTEALQGLVDLSDATRPRNMAEVRRRLVYAQRLLSTAEEAAPPGGLEAASSTSAPLPLPVPPASATPPAPRAMGASAPRPAPVVALGEPSAPPPFLLRVGQPDERENEEEDLERDLDNLRKILEASWAI
jgi:hypothetical protein